ncbi:KamA family radical SAM protein [Paenibacillus cymbidii]|uniref:KamA family radical SAM protein n=1 Tax=Paenibacillus cymbidii TaxID=1639034 RepID=UPI0010816EC1|nr:KamA family radical SAM protein [Paenibacillus cymbidii]
MMQQPFHDQDKRSSAVPPVMRPDQPRGRARTASAPSLYASDYYLRLIQWNDPHDPIRLLLLPVAGESHEYVRWDASDGDASDMADGCRHHHPSSATLYVSNACYCRYCFGKRLFRDGARESCLETEPGLAYIAAHPEISHVTLGGGDGLMLETSALRHVIERLRSMPHVKVIRFGSMMPVFQPMRIYEDEALLELIRSYSSPERKIHISVQIHHPRELTPEALQAIRSLREAGATVVSQTPIWKGVNDDAGLLSELLDRLPLAGVLPYSLFVVKPQPDRHHFALPLADAYRLAEQAKRQSTGLGKRARLSMYHASGKMELLAVENGRAYLKYHQSREQHLPSFVSVACAPGQLWIDELPAGNGEPGDRERALFDQTDRNALDEIDFEIDFGSHDDDAEYVRIRTHFIPD